MEDMVEKIPNFLFMLLPENKKKMIIMQFFLLSNVTEEGRGQLRMLVVSQSLQNYQNGAVRNQLMDVGKGGQCIAGMD